MQTSNTICVNSPVSPLEGLRQQSQTSETGNGTIFSALRTMACIYGMYKAVTLWKPGGIPAPKSILGPLYMRHPFANAQS